MKSRVKTKGKNIKNFNQIQINVDFNLVACNLSQQSLQAIFDVKGNLFIIL